MIPHTVKANLQNTQLMGDPIEYIVSTQGKRSLINANND